MKYKQVYLKSDYYFSKDPKLGIEFLIASLIEFEELEIPGFFPLPINSGLKVKTFVFNLDSPIARWFLNAPKKIELNLDEFKKGYLESSIAGKEEAYFHSDLKNVF